MKDLEADVKAFGIEFGGWREAAQKVGRWFRRVEVAEVFMRKCHKDEKEATAERPKTFATATLTGGASTRAREEGGGMVSAATRLAYDMYLDTYYTYADLTFLFCLRYTIRFSQFVYYLLFFICFPPS